jgi:hypothetical protein
MNRKAIRMINSISPKHVVTLLASIGLLGACMDRELVRVDPVTETYVLDQIVATGSAGVDVLVMVDNSVSMMDEQTLLASNFPELIRSLLQPVDAVNNLTNAPPADGKADHVPVKDLHIGVISPDMGTGGKLVTGCSDSVDGDDGILQHEPNPMVMGCDSAYPKFLAYGPTEESPPVRAPGDPALPEIEKMANDFGCIATLGNEGCGFEQQLEAVLKALGYHAKDPPDGSGENSGFLRTDTILAVLVITDEEDCSVDVTNPDNLRIFDESLTDTMGVMNLRCMLHPEMVYPIGRYVEGFAGLRDDPQNFVMGLIVGVPKSVDAPACTGFADSLGGCLDDELMRAEEDPDNPGYMHQSCISEDPMKGAYPPRRFIELARAFVARDPEILGQNIYVHSICSGDYTPAITAITNKIHEIIDKKGTARELELVKDADDPRGCTCMAECRIIETLRDVGACPSPKTALDEDGDTAGDVFIDDLGQSHTLCEIPHARMTITGGTCGCCRETTPEDPGGCDCTMDCSDQDAHLAQSLCGADPCPGWWYDPYYDPDGEGGLPPSPTLMLTGVQPEDGSVTNIQCRSEICPSLRRCGTNKCCDLSEYCYENPRTEEMLCLVRPDICDDFGEDLWCPCEIFGLPADYQGLCCLDPDMDGILDMDDIDGDTLMDVPAYRCIGAHCVRR